MSEVVRSACCCRINAQVVATHRRTPNVELAVLEGEAVTFTVALRDRPNTDTEVTVESNNDDVTVNREIVQVTTRDAEVRSTRWATSSRAGALAPAGSTSTTATSPRTRSRRQVSLRLLGQAARSWQPLRCCARPGQ